MCIVIEKYWDERSRVGMFGLSNCRIDQFIEGSRDRSSPKIRSGISSDLETVPDAVSEL